MELEDEDSTEGDTGSSDNRGRAEDEQQTATGKSYL
jgi:hypothetical protein